jgi:predicted acetyltransferase
MDRFLVAMDGDHMVAAGGSFRMELTVPGGAVLPTSGVTWVSVMASHRRQGILRQLMQGLDELAVEFDEPTLVLASSEGAIYERFGYGIGTRTRAIELDRRQAQIDPSLQPDQVDLVYAADHLDGLMERYDRYRLTQPGEVSRSEAQFRDQNLAQARPDFAALHPDGYAVWEVEQNWNGGHPAHQLVIKDLIAATPAAHMALWNLLLSVDLVGPIRTMRSVAGDDALPYLLTDHRAMKTVGVNDMLWIKVADPARSFSSRTYRTDDRLVIGVQESLHVTTGVDGSAIDESLLAERVSVGPGGCRQSDEPVDLVATRASLGALLLGATD